MISSRDHPEPPNPKAQSPKTVSLSPLIPQRATRTRVALVAKCRDSIIDTSKEPASEVAHIFEPHRNTEQAEPRRIHQAWNRRTKLHDSVIDTSKEPAYEALNQHGFVGALSKHGLDEFVKDGTVMLKVATVCSGR